MPAAPLKVDGWRVLLCSWIHRRRSFLELFIEAALISSVAINRLAVVLQVCLWCSDEEASWWRSEVNYTRQEEHDRGGHSEDVSFWGPLLQLHTSPCSSYCDHLVCLEVFEDFRFFQITFGTIFKLASWPCRYFFLFLMLTHSFLFASFKMQDEKRLVCLFVCCCSFFWKAQMRVKLLQRKGLQLLSGLVSHIWGQRNRNRQKRFSAETFGLFLASHQNRKKNN